MDTHAISRLAVGQMAVEPRGMVRDINGVARLELVVERTASSEYRVYTARNGRCADARQVMRCRSVAQVAAHLSRR